jgi:hypothetical protein
LRSNQPNIRVGRSTAGQHHLFLLALGAGIEVVGHGYHHRGADRHQARVRLALDDVELVAGGVDVVAHEVLPVVAADLGLQHDDGGPVGEVARPFARLGQVGVFHGDAGLHAAQHFQVGAVLVEHHQVAVAARHQASHQVLANQPGAAGQDDLAVQVSHAVSSVGCLCACVLIC